jgi:hypothetical protein
MLTLEHIGLLNGLLSIEFLKAFSLGCWNGYFGGRFLSHHHYFCGHPIVWTQSAFVPAWPRNELSGVSFSCATHVEKHPSLPLPYILFVLLEFLKKKKKKPRKRLLKEVRINR